MAVSSAAGSAAIRPSGEVAAGGHRPHRTSAQLEPSSSVCPPTGPLARLLDTTADARPPQRSHCRWPLCRKCVGHPLSAQRPADRTVSQAQQPADMAVEAAAEGPQRFRPGGGNGTGCRTHLTAAGPLLPGHLVRPQDDVAAHRTGRRKQRMVNPPMVPASLQLPRLFLKAGPCGRPPTATVLAPAATRRPPGSRPHRQAW